MPQLILEYSANVLEKDNLHTLLQQCHSILAEQLPTDLASCKSRVIKHTNYYIGDGQPKNAFVHIRLQIMPGRTAEIKDEVGKALLEALNQHFMGSLQKLDLQITLEISELQTYFKIM